MCASASYLPALFACMLLFAFAGCRGGVAVNERGAQSGSGAENPSVLQSAPRGGEPTTGTVIEAEAGPIVGPCEFEVVLSRNCCRVGLTITIEWDGSEGFVLPNWTPIENKSECLRWWQDFALVNSMAFSSQEDFIVVKRK